MVKQDTGERTDPHYLDKVKAFCCNLKSSMREKDAMQQSSHGDCFCGVGGNEGRGSKARHKSLRTGVSEKSGREGHGDRQRSRERKGQIERGREK